MKFVSDLLTGKDNLSFILDHSGYVEKDFVTS
jgi:hypothetical protein